ncbi:hypothetical protein [Dyadobacter sp. BHUBP1]|uniref:hypothetical protein n=1 Tax=Dyadobacter sp. BHUBP1 TaxID=3424178 RepID=UPI003D34A145
MNLHSGNTRMGGKEDRRRRNNAAADSENAGKMVKGYWSLAASHLFVARYSSMFVTIFEAYAFKTNENNARSAEKGGKRLVKGTPEK